MHPSSNRHTGNVYNVQLYREILHVRFEYESTAKLSLLKIIHARRASMQFVFERK